MGSPTSRVRRSSVAGANTDLTQYDELYLVLDSERLNGFEARACCWAARAGRARCSLEIDVNSATDIVSWTTVARCSPVRSCCSRPAVTITVESGSASRDARSDQRQLGRSVRLTPSIASVIDDKGTPYDWDDEPVHGDFGIRARCCVCRRADMSTSCVTSACSIPRRRWRPIRRGSRC